jgi:hypothetical protein
MALTEVQDQTFVRTIVEMDGKRFTGCKFISCTLWYTGEQPCIWKDTIIDEGCVWKFDGCALNLIRVLSAINALRIPLSYSPSEWGGNA